MLISRRQDACYSVGRYDDAYVPVDWPPLQSGLHWVVIALWAVIALVGVAVWKYPELMQELWGTSTSRRRRVNRPKLVPFDSVDWEKARGERHILVRFLRALPGWVLRGAVVRPVCGVGFVVWFPVGFVLVFFVFRWLYPCWERLWAGKDMVGPSSCQEEDGGLGRGHGHEHERGDQNLGGGGFGGRPQRYRMLTREEYRRRLRALLMWRLRGKHNHGAAGSLDGDCYFDDDRPRGKPAHGFNWSRKWVVGPNREAVPPWSGIPPLQRSRSPSPSPLPVIGQPEKPRPRAEEGRDDGLAEVQTASMVWVNLSRKKWMTGPNGDAIPPGCVIPAAGERLMCTSRKRVPWEVVNLWGIGTHTPSPVT